MSGTGGSADFGVSFPPNARLAAVEFIGDEMRVTFEDGGAGRRVAPADLRAVSGASIRRETMLPDPTRPSTLADKVVGKANVEVQEGFQDVVAIRPASGREVWYFVADSFNFRAALGAATGLVLATNLRAFLTRLVAFAPHLVQDAFVTATIGGLPAPPPVSSLLEFLKVASR